MGQVKAEIRHFAIVEGVHRVSPGQLALHETLHVFGVPRASPGFCCTEVQAGKFSP